MCCSVSSSKCFFLTCIQISQETGQVVWYSHLLKNFPQFVIHTVKGFSIVNKAEVDCFSCNSLAFSMIQQMARVNIGVYVSFSVMVSSGYMPSCGIAGTYGSFTPSFLRDLRTVLHSGCISLHFYQQSKKVSFSPHPL